MIKFSIVLVLVAVSAFLVTTAAAPHMGKLTLLVFDRFDDRAGREILFIGNSRTFYNDLPFMVRAIADSAGSQEKLEINVLAFEGGSLEQSWKDSGVQHALAKPWETVVLQPESRAQSGESARTSFFRYAKALAGQVKASHTAFIVNWAYGAPLYDGGATARSRHVVAIKDDYRLMAAQTDADLIDTAHAWEILLAERPDFDLYEDGNHPSVYGSYLSAMMIYNYLSNSDGTAVSYVPAQMSSEHAAQIRRVAAQAFNAN